MDEYHEAYYLRTDNQDEAINLLDRSGLHGFVFPTDGRWTGLMAQGPPLNVNKRLVFCNTGTLVHLAQAGNSMWLLGVFKNQETISSYRASVYQPAGVVDELDVTAIANLLHVDPDSIPKLHAVFSPNSIHAERVEDKPWERFAALVNIDIVRESSYDTLAEIYDDDEPGFAGIVEVSPKREEEDLPSRIKYLSGDKQLWLPRGLHGDKASTRRAMKKIMQKGWEAEDWSEVFSELEMVPFSDFPDEIYLEPGQMILPPTEKVWRLYPISRELRNVAFSSELAKLELKRNDKTHRLAIKGMEHFWFALAFLSQEERYSFGFDGEDITSEQACRSFLEGFVRWLPEIVAIEPFLRSSSSFLSPHQFARVWGDNIITVAMICGWKYSVDRYQGEFWGDLVAYLLADGIIEPYEGRYRVK